MNASRMWHKQDLKEVYDNEGNFIRTFRYKNLTETPLFISYEEKEIKNSDYKTYLNFLENQLEEFSKNTCQRQRCE